MSPEIDETPLPHEAPDRLVLRLAESKALKIAEQLASPAIIIGSDQTAGINGKLLGKPGGRDQAIVQLSEMSGRCARFYTGLCLLSTDTGYKQAACVPTDVYFRRLTRLQIERYLDREQPFQCAGSFKSEAFGITLVEKIDGADPTALIGLPLIKLTEMLSKINYELP